MQGERGYLNSCPETIDLNQGSDANSASMEETARRDNPVETRLSNHAFSSIEENNTPPNPPRANSWSHGGWFAGESSSNAHSRTQLFGRELKSEQGWSSSASAYTEADTSAIDWRFQRPNVSIYDCFPRPLNATSTFDPVNANVSHGDVNPNGVSPNIYQPGGSEAQPFHNQYSGQNNDGFVSSSSWGSSCKRKAVEGCSDPSSPTDEVMWRRSIPAHPNTSGSSRLLTERNSVRINHHPFDRHPPAGAGEVTERSPWSFGVEAYSGQHESSVPLFAAERSDLDPMFSRPMPVNHPPNPASGRSTVPFSRGQFFSQGASSSDPLFFSSQVESAARSGPSSFHVYPSSSSWSVPPAWTPHQNPGTHTEPRFLEQSPWTPFPPVESAPGGQRSHFSAFPSGGHPVEAVTQAFPSGGYPVEAVTQSGSSTGTQQNPSHPQSFWRDVSNDDINGWRALNARRGRRDRLLSEIHHVLNAMQRAENLGPEEFMMEDPYFNEIADLHDSHRDMRLDVDNMSYEELLALEERIGNVNTGLSEDAVMQLMKQQKYKPVTRESSSQEPCCVCREEYMVGDDIGKLDCGHQFHTNCIKQWLMLKNLCPICKLTGLRP